MNRHVFIAVGVLALTTGCATINDRRDTDAAITRATFTVPEAILLGEEFAGTSWGGTVVTSDAPGPGVQFSFSGLSAAGTGVKDDYPVAANYGQETGHGGGDFSRFRGYTLRMTNLDSQPVRVSLIINTGFTGESGVPTRALTNDTLWQSPWHKLEPKHAKVLCLDFDRAIAYNIEDNQPPHSQGGKNGALMRINAYDRTEVSAIGFQICAQDNPEAAILVTPCAVR